jgi:type IV pilus assembly protein PilW
MSGLCRRLHYFGFSLVELMVASTVGLLIVGALVTVFVQTGRSNNEMAKLNQQMENGRFALQLLREDLWHAGFWGEYRPPDTVATALPPMCTAFSDWTPSDIANVLRVPVMGADDTVPTECTTLISNRKAGTDVLLVRHASTCVADTGADNNCENFEADKLYLQVSRCSADAQELQMGTSPALFLLRKRDSSGKNCTASGYTTTYADRRKVLSHLYYIRIDNTLMRSELDYKYDSATASGTVKQLGAQPLVGGIEHMEIEYGVDADGDGSADSLVSTPADAAAWGNVVAVRVHLLARSLEATSGHDDSKVYQLGPTRLPASPADGFHDGFARHVYSSFIRLQNPAGRRDNP